MAVSDVLRLILALHASLIAIEAPSLCKHSLSRSNCFRLVSVRPSVAALLTQTRRIRRQRMPSQVGPLVSLAGPSIYPQFFLAPDGCRVSGRPAAVVTSPRVAVELRGD
jgi:hypothetical protein